MLSRYAGWQGFLIQNTSSDQKTGSEYTIVAIFPVVPGKLPLCYSFSAPCRVIKFLDITKHEGLSGCDGLIEARRRLPLVMNL